MASIFFCFFRFFPRVLPWFFYNFFKKKHLASIFFKKFVSFFFGLKKKHLKWLKSTGLMASKINFLKFSKSLRPMASILRPARSPDLTDSYRFAEWAKKNSAAPRPFFRNFLTAQRRNLLNTDRALFSLNRAAPRVPHPKKIRKHGQPRAAHEPKCAAPY